MPLTRIQPAAIADTKGVNFRNIIINGDMSIAQRRTSQTSAGNSVGTYDTVDRFAFANQNMGAFTMSQDTDVPSSQGFAKSLKLDCTTADASPVTNDYLIFLQKFEGQNLQYLKKGTSNATSLTLSFWVKSNKTGTYIAELHDLDNARTINKSYTVDTANTWEKKTITYAGDTTGTLDNDNGGSLSVQFWLGAGTNFTSGTLATSWQTRTNANRAVGQVNLADTVGNEWYITGVQLEAGISASDFEFLPVDVNLGRCERYYQADDFFANGYIAAGEAFNTTQAGGVYFFKKMRVAPSVTIPPASKTNGARWLTANGGEPATVGTNSIIRVTDNNCVINSTGYTGLTNQSPSILLCAGAQQMKMDAEL